MFSPYRVIGRLASCFPPDYSAPTRKEIAIADAFRGILQNAMYGDIDCADEDETLQIDLDEEQDVEWSPDDDDDVGGNTSPCHSEKVLVCDGRGITSHMLEQALEYYRGTTKKSRPLSSMANRFTWMRTNEHLKLLHNFEKQKQIRETRALAFKRLSAALREMTTDAVEKGLPLSYAIIRQMALRINREQGFVEGFKASKQWISNFVRECGLCSRKVTSFVTTRSLRNRTEIEAAAAAFLENVKEEMKKYPLSAFCNVDQTGINREVVSNRTLAPTGSKQVSRVVQSLSSLTHSYTVVTVLYADGRLGEKLFVILQEAGGEFPRSGHWSAPNLHVVAGTSHIMTKRQVPLFNRECVVDSLAPPLTILLLDSWSGFRDHANLLSDVPAGKDLKLMTIPPGATSLCQPLDVYFFRLFKRLLNFVELHTSNAVALCVYF